MEECTVEISVDGHWRVVGHIQLVGGAAQGVRGAATLTYDDEYAFEYLDRLDWRAVSCRHPVMLGSYCLDNWPHFLLDMMPAGAGRRFWELRLNLPNNRTSDWALLRAGAMNPPGNLRIKEAAAGLGELSQPHDGFAREDIIVKSETFLAYAQHNGAAITGSSGAQGDAPKMLLSQDIHNRWHPSGTLPPHLVAQEWLVKFPRGRDERDRAILYAESVYYEIAALAGVSVAGPLTWENDCLFVPRFDTAPTGDGKQVRYGLESLCSLMGIADFAVPTTQEQIIGVLRAHTSCPATAVSEFIVRDVLNVAMGNTDNHGRNHAVLKSADGTVALSPLYDFAPMMIDPALIPRVSAWQREIDRAGNPDWAAVLARTCRDFDEHQQVATRVHALTGLLETVADRLRERDVHDLIVTRCAARCSDVIKAISEV